MATFLDIVSPYPERIQQLAQNARIFIKDRLPNIKEEFDISAKLVGYSYGSGYKGMICTLILSQKNIKIGFYKGIELQDPNGLLKGTGKVHKHVVVQKEEELNEALGALFSQAATNYTNRQGQ